MSLARGLLLLESENNNVEARKWRKENLYYAGMKEEKDTQGAERDEKDKFSK